MTSLFPSLMRILEAALTMLRSAVSTLSDIWYFARTFSRASEMVVIASVTVHAEGNVFSSRSGVTFSALLRDALACCDVAAVCAFGKDAACETLLRVELAGPPGGGGRVECLQSRTESRERFGLRIEVRRGRNF